jgi:hypothetical protein
MKTKIVFGAIGSLIAMIAWKIFCWAYGIPDPLDLLNTAVLQMLQILDTMPGVTEQAHQFNVQLIQTYGLIWGLLGLMEWAEIAGLLLTIYAGLKAPNRRRRSDRQW